jgi:3-oxoacyl-[acyl-carrier protein] reductase
MAEAKPLEGRVALVTGSGRGIGRAIAQRLADDGAAVVINDLDADVARAASAEIPNSAVAVGSVTDSADTDAMVAVAEREFGTLDIVVNNAGLTKDGMLHKMDDATWDLVIDVALKGPFRVCRSAARLLRRKDAGHNRKVVNISSINGIYGVAFNANYCAAKGGVNGLTKSLAREWAPLGINVNAVAPGFIETRLTAARNEGDELGIPPEALEQIQRQFPMGRPGSPEDVAGLVAWLSTSDADYVTGQILEIHGGLEIVKVG